ncbi:hypothetical protein [Corynebacterium lubricantis]|uniref:hypothetical protein n=1 Tax=Corynebacterium lubricantis TaxID=541095 RepID=UPI00035FC8B4|nr:hypothetical protein [Corynebacterium lubricantis]
MKLRKALVAAATALTVATAGTVVANAEDNPAASSTATNVVDAPDTEKDPETDTETTTTEEASSDLSSNINTDDPNELKSWIGVFTAVITALGAAFAFITKYFV